MSTGEAYDAIAGAYEARKLSAPPARWSEELLRRLVQRLPPGARVLDVGCGPGVELARLRAAGLEAYGVDLSRRVLRAARGRAGDRVVQGDVLRLPFADGTLDGAWSLHALLHVADLGRALAEVARVLRPGAPAALTLALGQGVTREPVAYAPAVTRTFVHHREAAARQALHDAGLDVTRAGVDDDGRPTLWVEARARASGEVSRAGRGPRGPC